MLFSLTLTMAIEPGCMLVAMVALLFWLMAEPACLPSVVYTETFVLSSTPSTVINPLSVFTRTGCAYFDTPSLVTPFVLFPQDSCQSESGGIDPDFLLKRVGDNQAAFLSICVLRNLLINYRHRINFFGIDFVCSHTR